MNRITEQIRNAAAAGYQQIQKLGRAVNQLILDSTLEAESTILSSDARVAALASQILGLEAHSYLSQKTAESVTVVEIKLPQSIALKMTIAEQASVTNALIKLTEEERQEILTLVEEMDGQFTKEIIGDDIQKIIHVLTSIPANERKDTFALIQRFEAPVVTAYARIRLLETLVRFPENERAGVLAAYLQRFEAPGAENNVIGIHAYGRDEKTIEALALLRTATGPMSPEEIAQGVADFTTYLEKAPVDESKRALAFRALNGPYEKNNFDCLLGDPECMSYKISGEEVIARLWKYASSFKDPKDESRNEIERNLAKLGMVTALSKSFGEAGGTRLCNEGKIQRLAIAILQGRLPGVNIDGIEVAPNIQVLEPGLVAPEFLPIKVAAELFFQIPAHREIESRAKLVATAIYYLHTNPNIEKEEFLKEIEQYANLQEMEKVENEAELLAAASGFYEGEGGSEAKQFFRAELLAYANQPAYFKLSEKDE